MYPKRSFSDQTNPVNENESENCHHMKTLVFLDNPQNPIIAFISINEYKIFV